MLTAISAHALIKFIWRFIPNSSNLKNLTKVSHYMMFILHVCRSWTLVWLELLTRRSWWPPMSSLDTTELLRSLSQQNTRRTVGARAQYMGVYVCVGGRWMVGGKGGIGIAVMSLECMWLRSVLPSVHVHVHTYKVHLPSRSFFFKWDRAQKLWYGLRPCPSCFPPSFPHSLIFTINLFPLLISEVVNAH